ncbi:TIR domain-containing protein [Arthrobacter sp. ERGS1:01]|uniref:TIR domain-containing protein n=1 Tax=Arthrobacter sp. ERGS1:01 TaxID=1704044 RepID=UPI000A40CD68|nr:TIR domain-containing protein [Arthrobacter sp. ERGS1:01]
METSTNRRATIFIASSTEAIDIAVAAKANFDSDFDVQIWNENVFTVNRSYLETLLNRASYYDFAIAIFTPDDLAVVHHHQVHVARDNVIFEFGLFLGRLGPNRTFLLAQRGTGMFSDWDGIDVATFEPGGDLVGALKEPCDRLRHVMGTAAKRADFTMLPSTSLAIGYYQNFLRKVFSAFEHSKSFQVIEKDENGEEIATSYDLKNHYPTIEIRMPANLIDLEQESLNRYTSSYKRIIINAKSRPFPFYVSGRLSAKGQSLHLFDVPTTMLSSKLAIDEYFSADFLAQDDTRRTLESREIANFEHTLRVMVPDWIERKYFRFSIWKTR